MKFGDTVLGLQSGRLPDRVPQISLSFHHFESQERYVIPFQALLSAFACCMTYCRQDIIPGNVEVFLSFD